jgi:hypothetical protein
MTARGGGGRMTDDDDDDGSQPFGPSSVVASDPIRAVSPSMRRRTNNEPMPSFHRR